MEKNTRSIVKTNGSKDKDCVIGLVQPNSGETYFLQTEWMDSVVISYFFNELIASYSNKKHLIVLDNVAYHRCQGKEGYPIPKNIELMFLPPYSPDFNPIERLWKYFKDVFLNNRLFKTLKDLKDAVYDALKIVLEQKDLVKSICAIS